MTEEKAFEQEEFDLDDIRYFMNLPVEEKLAQLENLNRFLNQTTPAESKKIWERLKAEGF